MVRRTEQRFGTLYDSVLKRTDRMFAYLMVAQWTAAIFAALWLSPYAWAGRAQTVHVHVWAAVLIGGAITVLPVTLAFLQPGKRTTRYVIAVGQMLWSALLIHLTGGRIETHFHVFGSLAFLAFYRDARVLIPATAVVTADHFLRGVFWSESVYGIVNPEWWRFLEHAGWVVFIDAFLIMNCVQSRRELWKISAHQVELEQSQAQALRMERLAAVGQLAASVGHELRNPLAAVSNAQTYLARRLRGPDAGPLGEDPKIKQFLGIMKRELDASAKIISNLLDFSRPRVPTFNPCPLRPLVDEALSLVPQRDGVRISNEIPDDMPVPELDKDQFRQVLINLIQNGVEAMPTGRSGTVVVAARGGGNQPWTLTVRDDGVGIPPEIADQIFQPLFSTKTKGTGLGLAVVASMVERHGGSLGVTSEPQQSTTFTIELPASPSFEAA
jgi:signal transduction histidine kinase